jgi:hypothetical protein
MFITEPLAIRKRVQEYASRPEPTELSTTQRGAAIGEISKALRVLKGMKGEELDNARRLILGWLFLPPTETLRPMSSKELTAQQVNGLRRWIGAIKIEEVGEHTWVTRAEFSEECHWVLARAVSHARFALQFNPPLPISEVLRLTTSEQVQERLDIEDGGMVSAGLQIGASEIRLTDEMQGKPAIEDPLWHEPVKEVTAAPVVQQKAGAYVGSLDEL